MCTLDALIIEKMFLCVNYVFMRGIILKTNFKTYFYVVKVHVHVHIRWESFERIQFVIYFENDVTVFQALMPLLLRAAADSPEEPWNSCSKAAIVNISSILGSLGENKTGGMYGYRPSKVSTVVLTRNFVRARFFKRVTPVVPLRPLKISSNVKF